jgi:tetratricopeptide (TPR) repeat protein
MSRASSYRVLILALLISVKIGMGFSTQAAAQAEDPRLRLVALAEAGLWAEAQALARDLLATRPRDVTVLIVLSRALRAAGDPAAARVHAARALDAAGTDAERFAALTELAAAAHAQGRPLAAQVWLRRAVQAAPDPALRDSAIRNYRAVAAGNPWTVQLQFGVAPSSNVNNGSQADTVDIGGLEFVLNPDAQALSGTEITAGISVARRHPGLSGLPARTGLAIALQEVRLSGSARAAAPEVEGDDFDQATVEWRFDQALTPATAPLRLRLEARLGHSWYGGQDLSDYLRAGFGADWGDAGGTLTSVALSWERQDRLDLASRSATILRLDAGRQWRLGPEGTLGLALFLRETASRSVEVDHRAAGLSASRDLGTLAGGWLSLAGGVGAEWRDYDRSPYSAGGRHDLRLRLSARLGFPRAETWGFVPELTVEATRVTSSVDLYDSRDVALRLGLRSAF